MYGWIFWQRSHGGLMKSRCSSIRQLEIDEQREPATIIALTAGMNQTDEDRCLEAGMSGYLAKPYSLSDLARFISPGSGAGHLAVAAEDRTDRAAVCPASPEIDAETILALQAMGQQSSDDDYFASLYDVFRSSMEERLPLLEQQLLEGDCNAAASTAHYIKSSSGSLGAREMSRLCEIIEAGCREGEIRDLPRQFTALDAACQRFLQTIERDWATGLQH